MVDRVVAELEEDGPGLGAAALPQALEDAPGGAVDEELLAAAELVEEEGGDLPVVFDLAGHRVDAQADLLGVPADEADAGAVGRAAVFVVEGALVVALRALGVELQAGGFELVGQELAVVVHLAGGADEEALEGEVERDEDVAVTVSGQYAISNYKGMSFRLDTTVYFVDNTCLFD